MSQFDTGHSLPLDKYTKGLFKDLCLEDKSIICLSALDQKYEGRTIVYSSTLFPITRRKKRKKYVKKSDVQPRNGLMRGPTPRIKTDQNNGGWVLHTFPQDETPANAY